MKRLRNAIFKTFEDELSRNFDPLEMSTTKRTRDWSALHSINAIPPTGGLGITLPKGLIIVDADRSGGINRLMQCWQFLARNRADDILCITLFYIFLSPSHAASETGHTLWDFVAGKARAECGEHLQVHFAACVRVHGLNSKASIPTDVIEQCTAQLEAQGILAAFERCLAGELSRARATSTPRPPSTTSSEGPSGKFPQVTTRGVF